LNEHLKPPTGDNLLDQESREKLPALYSGELLLATHFPLFDLEFQYSVGHFAEKFVIPAHTPSRGLCSRSGAEIVRQQVCVEIDIVDIARRVELAEHDRSIRQVDNSAIGWMAEIKKSGA